MRILQGTCSHGGGRKDPSDDESFMRVFAADAWKIKHIFTQYCILEICFHFLPCHFVLIYFCLHNCIIFNICIEQKSFFVMLVFLFCKLFEHHSQTNFPFIKTKPFKVAKYKKEWQIFRPKWVKIKIVVIILSLLLKNENKDTHYKYT